MSAAHSRRVLRILLSSALATAVLGGCRARTPQQEAFARDAALRAKQARAIPLGISQELANRLEDLSLWARHLDCDRARIDREIDQALRRSGKLAHTPAEPSLDEAFRALAELAFNLEAVEPRFRKFVCFEYPVR